MFSSPLPTDVQNLFYSLSRAFDDFVWLDSADNSGFSIMAFDADNVQTFADSTSHNAFSKFLKNFSLNEKPDSSFVLSPVWIGFFSYESHVFNPLTGVTPKTYKGYPLAVWRHYNSFVFIEKEKTTFVSFSDEAEKKYNTLRREIYNPEIVKKTPSPAQKSKIIGPDWQNYQNHFSQIQQSLVAGDYFQLNYTIDFQCQVNDFSAEETYERLRTTCKAPMMAFYNWPEVRILSASPEKFLKITPDCKISVFPIKGTSARGASAVEDEQKKHDLQNSEKERAELLMVTDLLRNDLGRICQNGSIETPRLFSIETFSHYHHLVSEITGKLCQNITFYDIFLALFPGGSIVGAPKIEVMQHIQKLEGRPRGVYTGALGLIAESGFCEFNIPIRTLIQHDNTLEFSTGGGITIDSDVSKEYEECQIKAKGLFATFFPVLLFLFLLCGCNNETENDAPDTDDLIVVIENNQFIPQTFSAESGATIFFENLDGTPHQILSQSAEDHFDDTQIFSSEIITTNNFGFIELPDDAETGEIFYFYCGIFTDAMATPNGVIEITD